MVQCSINSVEVKVFIVFYVTENLSLKTYGHTGKAAVYFSDFTDIQLNDMRPVAVSFSLAFGNPSGMMSESFTRRVLAAYPSALSRTIKS